MSLKAFVIFLILVGGVFAVCTAGIIVATIRENKEARDCASRNGYYLRTGNNFVCVRKDWVIFQ